MSDEKTRAYSVLDEDLSKIAVRCNNVYHIRELHGVFFCMETFQRHLLKTYDFIDLMSFGASADCCRVPVRRAIVGLGGRTDCKWFKKPKELKKFTDVHAKIVIGYKKQPTKPSGRVYEFCDVFLGSHNFVAPTLHEIMIKVTDPWQKAAVLEFYESFWHSRSQPKQPAKGNKQ